MPRAKEARGIVFRQKKLVGSGIKLLNDVRLTPNRAASLLAIILMMEAKDDVWQERLWSYIEANYISKRGIEWKDKDDPSIPGNPSQTDLEAGAVASDLIAAFMKSREQS